MSQSLVQIYLHLVFSTKERRPFLTDKGLRSNLHAYLVGACNNKNCPAIQIGGVEDHVHLLIRLGKQMDVSTLIRELKRESSKWIKQESAKQSNFQWQSGYGAFSISPAHVNPLVTYINMQEEHHKRETFQDEFRRLCKRYSIELDERYVWH